MGVTYITQYILLILTGSAKFQIEKLAMAPGHEAVFVRNRFELGQFQVLANRLVGDD